MTEITRVLSQGAMLDLIATTCGETDLGATVLDDASFVDSLDSIQVAELVFTLSEMLPAERRAAFEETALSADTLGQVLQAHTFASLQ